MISMPSEPPKTIRTTERVTEDPELIALKIPARISPTTVIATIVKTLPPSVGARAPKIGITPPAMKLKADAKAAWKGRARVRWN